MKNKKIHWFHIVLIFCFCTYSARSQDVYQESVNEGFSIRASLLTDIWKGEIITDNYTATFGMDMTMTYGLTENFAVFGSFQYLIPSGLDMKEIKYLLFTEKISHQNFLTGIKYTGGSTSSKLRYSIELGAVFAQSSMQSFYKIDAVYADIDLKGTGVHGGIGIEYFLAPFFSFDFNLGYKTGKYTSSEFLGLTYKESLSWNRINIMAGGHYHFGGR